MNNKEIERKFLVDEKWTPKGDGTKILQFYLSDKPTVRVRIAGSKAFITIKGPTVGLTRSEFEYEIPMPDAIDMMNLSILNPIEKTRYDEFVDGLHWTVDVFEGKNHGLIIAEIELESEDDIITIPDWAIEDVSDISSYYNSNLAETPFQEWNMPGYHFRPHLT